ncbi:hypothetical protein [Yoonia sp. SS1-5]|uniref:Uncharacterized protein n=1 Tax=Yoonia rhodophyticola TaxID=3137370 RepID=A0AAN0MAX0_9RHOB
MRHTTRKTFMLNLDEAHASKLDDLRQHFHLAADDTIRLAIRLTHARMSKPDVLVPEFKPHGRWDYDFDSE